MGRSLICTKRNFCIKSQVCTKVLFAGRDTFAKRLFCTEKLLAQVEKNFNYLITYLNFLNFIIIFLYCFYYP